MRPSMIPQVNSEIKMKIGKRAAARSMKATLYRAQCANARGSAGMDFAERGPSFHLAVLPPPRRLSVAEHQFDDPRINAFRANAVRQQDDAAPARFLTHDLVAGPVIMAALEPGKPGAFVLVRYKSKARRKTDRGPALILPITQRRKLALRCNGPLRAHKLFARCAREPVAAHDRSP